MKKLFLLGAVVFTMSLSNSAMAVNEVAQPTVTITADTCTTVAQLAYNLAISEGATHPDAVIVSNLAYDNCKKTTD